MGSCVSNHRNSSDPAMKLRVIPESPMKEKPAYDDRPITDVAIAHKSQWSPSRSTTAFADFGSKEETFFETQQWLESDCEDDYYSVNGDFTPSRGNTPVHHSFSPGIPRVNKALIVDRTPNSIPQPSPTDKKKKLSELFQETDQDADDQYSSGNQKMAEGKMEAKPTIVDLPLKSSNGTPFVSGTTSMCSSERTVNGDSMFVKERPMRSMQCCLPSLVSCRSFNDRKKKMSPAIA